MDEQVRIEILADDDVVIKYAEVKEDVVSRQDVEAFKNRKEELLASKKLIEEQLEELDKKLAFAEKIIALADEKKAAAKVEEEVHEEPVEAVAEQPVE